jgi:hypothetical protein
LLRTIETNVLSADRNTSNENKTIGSKQQHPLTGNVTFCATNLAQSQYIHNRNFDQQVLIKLDVNKMLFFPTTEHLR